MRRNAAVEVLAWRVSHDSDPSIQIVDHPSRARRRSPVARDRKANSVGEARGPSLASSSESAEGSEYTGGIIGIVLASGCFRMLLPHEQAAPRVLLYSHDSYGLGHLRRTLTLGSGLRARFPATELLCVSGSPCSSLFSLPAGVGLVKLPSVTKDDRGRYVPRTLGSSLARLIRMREALLLGAYRSFRPDVVLVDHKVIGLEGEALPMLRAARAEGVRTLLGIRDIIDEPAVVAKEWSDDRSRWALSEGYDRICVFGSPDIFDPREEYPILAELAPRVEFAGYVVRERDQIHRRPVPPVRPQVLVTGGGGEDAFERMSVYLDILEKSPVPWNSLLVAGPLMDDSLARRSRRRARMLGNAEVRRFYADMPRLLSECDVVVSMAGYNTASEILQSRKPWVALPRTRPRLEQALRADCLSRLGLVRTLVEPKPEELRRAVFCALERGPMPAEKLPDLDGAARVATIVAELLYPGVLVPHLKTPLDDSTGLSSSQSSNREAVT